MMKQLIASIAAQAATLTSLSTKTNSRSEGGGGQNTNKNKSMPVLHVCAHCKREVYHKELNCLEIEANQAKRYTGWKSVFTK